MLTCWPLMVGEWVRIKERWTTTHDPFWNTDCRVLSSTCSFVMLMVRFQFDRFNLIAYAYCYVNWLAVRSCFVQSSIEKSALGKKFVLKFIVLLIKLYKNFRLRNISPGIRWMEKVPIGVNLPSRKIRPFHHFSDQSWLIMRALGLIGVIWYHAQI